MMEKNGNGAPETLHFDEEVCERYLFGELTEAEQEEFETAYFNDDVFFDRFMAVKTELLDLYTRGELRADKRARMEPHFLATSPRARRLAESHEFIQAVTSIAERDRVPTAVVIVEPFTSRLDWIQRLFTLPRLAAASVVLIVAVGGLFLLNRSSNHDLVVDKTVEKPPETSEQSQAPLPSDSRQPESEAKGPEFAADPPGANRDARRRYTRRETEVAREPKINPAATDRDIPDRPLAGNDNSRRPSPPHFVVGVRPSDDKATFIIDSPSGYTPEITLHAGATRTIGEGNTLTLDTAHNRYPARIRLIFRSERYEKYIVTMTTVAGREVFRNDDYSKRVVEETMDGSRSLVVRLNDTSEMKEKDYIIKLEGRNPGAAPETIDEYYFHVKRGAEVPAPASEKKP
jgi:hypothetical protein